MLLQSKPHILRQELRKLKNDTSKELNFCDGLRETQGDVVFLCQDNKPVECNSEILFIVSPMIRRIIKGATQNSYFVPKDFKIYISVEFNSKVILILLDMIYHQKSKVISKEHIEEFRSLVATLDINDSNFVKAEQTPDVEDDAIVEVINDLMDEYNVKLNQTQNEWEEMLLTTLDESFINDTLGANTSLDQLLTEPMDFEVQSKSVTPTETISDEVNATNEETIGNYEEIKKRGPIKKRKMKPTKHRLRDCGVEIENLSNKTLEYYVEILRSNKQPNPDESVLTTVNEAVADNKETAPETPKRKRKAKSFPDFEMDSVRKIAKPAKVSVLNESSNDSSLSPGEIASTQGESLKNPEPGELKVQTSPQELTSKPFDNIKTSDSDLQVVNVKKVKCLYCEESYTTRSRILQHLSVSHFQTEILARYPFVRGECFMCVELGKPKPMTAKNKQVHLLHVGSLHEKVIECLPEAFKSNIDQEFPVRKRAMKFKIKEEPLDDSNISNISSVLEDSVNGHNSSLLNISDMDPNAGSSSFEVSFQDSFAKSLLSSKIVEPAPVTSPIKTRKHEFFPQQSEDANHAPSSPAPSLSSGSSQEARGLLSCSLCPVSDMVALQYKTQMLSHLSLVHLSSELLTLFPFPKDGNCQICLELNKCFESKPVENFSDNESYVEHVGSHHERVLEILPTDICDKINSLQSEAAVLVIQEDSGHGSKDASILDISFESSLNSTAIGEDSNSGDISHSAVLDDSSIARFVELSQKVTSSEPSSGPAMPILRCKHCPEIFINTEERLIHIRNVHSNLRRKVYNCRYCDNAFKDPKQFKLHLLAHKKDLVQQ